MGAYVRQSAAPCPGRSEDAHAVTSSPTSRDKASDPRKHSTVIGGSTDHAGSTPICARCSSSLRGGNRLPRSARKEPALGHCTALHAMYCTRGQTACSRLSTPHSTPAHDARTWRLPCRLTFAVITGNCCTRPSCACPLLFEPAAQESLPVRGTVAVQQSPRAPAAKRNCGLPGARRHTSRGRLQQRAGPPDQA
jgi:hypothetical protein